MKRSAVGATSRAVRKAVSMKSVPVTLNQVLRRMQSGWLSSITSLATSQA